MLATFVLTLETNALPIHLAYMIFGSQVHAIPDTSKLCTGNTNIKLRAFQIAFLYSYRLFGPSIDGWQWWLAPLIAC